MHLIAYIGLLLYYKTGDDAFSFRILHDLNWIWLNSWDALLTVSVAGEYPNNMKENLYIEKEISWNGQ